MMNLWGVAVTATVTADGGLEPVGGLLPKLIAAARAATPRVHTVVIAQGKDHEKQLKAMNLVPAPLGWCDPTADFWVVPAETLTDAVTTLEDNRKHRWPRIDCCLPSPSGALDHSGDELVTVVSRFIETSQRRPVTSGRYLVVVANDQVSMTAAFSRAVAQYQRCHGEAVFHVVPTKQRQVPSTARSADTVASCLYQRLRRKWGGVEPAAWSALSHAERLERFLRDTRPGEVLWIDGADRITEGGGALIPDVLPDPLPQGVVGVMTTTREPNTFCAKFENVTVRRITSHT